MSVPESSRQILKPSHSYVYRHTVLLNETNAVGGVVYFSNFVKWQGMAREWILMENTDYKKIMSQPIEMATHSCSVLFHKHLYFGARVRIEIQTTKILPTSFVMQFRYFNDQTNDLVATGEQKITFMNTKSGELCRIPEEIMGLAKAVEVQTEL